MENSKNSLCKTLSNKLKPLFATHNENYVRYLLAHSSTKFMVLQINSFVLSYNIIQLGILAKN